MSEQDDKAVPVAPTPPAPKEDPERPRGEPPAPPLLKEPVVYSREDYIDAAKLMAEKMESEKDRTVKQGYADLAGYALKQVGIDADADKNNKFSQGEINDAIKGLPKLEMRDVPKAEEHGEKPCPPCPASPPPPPFAKSIG